MKNEQAKSTIILSVLLAALSFPVILGGAEMTTDNKQDVECTVYPAVPPRYSRLPVKGCSVQRSGDVITLANDYLAVDIPTKGGMIKSVLNKITGQKHALSGDQAGVVVRQGEEKVEWMCQAEAQHSFEVKLDGKPETASVRLAEKVGDLTITITYELKQQHFWVERRITVENRKSETTFERLIYGKLEVPGVKPNVLALGRYDRPRLITIEKSGLFGGVGWWFYQADKTGLYQNAGMDYACKGRFESEPWYVGVFQPEAGEPFPGQLWYTDFLLIRKAAYDKHPSYCYWNAGWGQWGLKLEDPASLPYVEMAHNLGVRLILFGGGLGGYGTPKYVELARTSEAAKQNIQAIRKRGMIWGCLPTSVYPWANTEVIENQIRLLQECVDVDLKGFAFDGFGTVDTFTAHRNVARYFRAAHDSLDYTECHLGMAVYGPQFQRLVLINHPGDISADMSPFSSDWGTFLGFRANRSGSLTQYNMYYFLTHYSNWGHAREYTDPEPQQFMYGPGAYCGVAYNFHDTTGFRQVIAAAAAFTPYYVFGHLDLKMPQRDMQFAREFMKWVEENAEILRLGRICLENGDVCVVSKIREGKGAVFALNKRPGRRVFRLTPAFGSSEDVQVRQVYPTARQPLTVKDPGAAEVSVSGESVAIFDVNGGLRSMPPTHQSHFPIDVSGWKISGQGREGLFEIPDVRKSLEANRDPGLPKELISLEQVGKGILDRGRLPEVFLETYGFRDGKIAETWKFAPWAFADRVWLVCRLRSPRLLSAPLLTLRINGKAAPLIPRIDYRRGKPENWTYPLVFADITQACNYGGANTVVLSGLKDEESADCYVASGACER